MFPDQATLAWWKGNARRLLDPDDLVQEVCRRILRRNRKPCAWDPEQGSLGHYVHQIAGNAVADMLAAHRRVVTQELHGDPERFDEHAAPEPDPDDAPFDPEAAPSDPDDREDFFRALCVLEVTANLPTTVQL